MSNFKLAQMAEYCDNLDKLFWSCNSYYGPLETFVQWMPHISQVGETTCQILQDLRNIKFEKFKLAKMAEY